MKAKSTGRKTGTGKKAGASRNDRFMWKKGDVVIHNSIDEWKKAGGKLHKGR